MSSNSDLRPLQGRHLSALGYSYGHRGWQAGGMPNAHGRKKSWCSKKLYRNISVNMIVYNTKVTAMPPFTPPSRFPSAPLCPALAPVVVHHYNVADRQLCSRSACAIPVHSRVRLLSHPPTNQRLTGNSTNSAEYVRAGPAGCRRGWYWTKWGRLEGKAATDSVGAAVGRGSRSPRGATHHYRAAWRQHLGGCEHDVPYYFRCQIEHENWVGRSRVDANTCCSTVQHNTAVVGAYETLADIYVYSRHDPAALEQWNGKAGYASERAAALRYTTALGTHFFF